MERLLTVCGPHQLLYLCRKAKKGSQMSDDLDALGAPIEAMRKEVQAAYKRLEEYWGAVMAKLAALPIPCDVGFCTREDPENPMFSTRLEWCKHKGKKRLCIVHYGLEQTHFGDHEETREAIPIEEWSGEERVVMKQFVPALFNAAIGQVKDFIEKTKQ